MATRDRVPLGENIAGKKTKSAELTPHLSIDFFVRPVIIIGGFHDRRNAMENASGFTRVVDRRLCPVYHWQLYWRGRGTLRMTGARAVDRRDFARSSSLADIRAGSCGAWSS